MVIYIAISQAREFKGHPFSAQMKIPWVWWILWVPDDFLLCVKTSDASGQIGTHQLGVTVAGFKDRFVRAVTKDAPLLEVEPAGHVPE